MENFLIVWVLVAMGLIAFIIVYDRWSTRLGGKALILFPDPIWPQGNYFLVLFFIVPFALLLFFFGSK